MILFIHGTGATSSFWLAHIRSLLGLGSKYSDKFLLDLFTISLPGHFTPDKQFQLSDTQDWINGFIQDKQSGQAALAKELIFSHSSKGIKLLRDKKLYIFAHSVGSVISLNYTIKNLAKVGGLWLFACGIRFSPVSVNLGNWFYQKIVFRLGYKKLQALAMAVSNLRAKTLYTLFAENIDRKGILSCVDIVKEYDFEKSYQRLSLDEQIKFRQMPLTLVGGGWDLLSTPFSLYSLKKYLQTKDMLVQQQASHPIDNIKEVKLKILPWSGHNAVDKVKINELI